MSAPTPQIIVLLVFVALSLSARARAESRTTIPSGTVRSHGNAPRLLAPSEGVSDFIGVVETRPSWNGSGNRFFTQNYLEVGAHTSAATSLSYQQQVIGEMSGGGQPFRLSDGFVRFKVNDIWTDLQFGKTTFSYELRTYLPTSPLQASRGMLFAVRNYFKLHHEISATTSFTFVEVLIPHVYRSDGILGDARAGTKSLANPIFENQVWLMLNWTALKSGWSFCFPLILSSTRYRSFRPDRERGGEWVQWFEVYPELNYELSKEITLGVGYESDNLINVQTHPDPARVTEVGSGTLQFVIRGSF